MHPCFTWRRVVDQQLCTPVLVPDGDDKLAACKAALRNIFVVPAMAPPIAAAAVAHPVAAAAVPSLNSPMAAAAVAARVAAAAVHAAAPAVQAGTWI